jgi:16S rRNA (adenine(1408)-N(1))-methyltransferase
LIARHERVVVDLGTGDGRAVLTRARAEPRNLVVGLDPVAAAMAESSRRGARVPNALFALASAEAVPAELVARADDVSVLFPWASLLRGVLVLPGGDAAADGMASLLRPAGRVTAIVSVTDRDRTMAGLEVDDRFLRRLADAHAARGLLLCEAAPATAAEIAATGSTWGRRLGAARGLRPAWRLVFERMRDRHSE